MAIAQWLITNRQEIVSLAGLILAIGVSIDHLAHKEDVAKSFQDMEDTINKLQK